MTVAGIFTCGAHYRCLLLRLERREDKSLWWRLTQDILTNMGFENLFKLYMYDTYSVLMMKEDIRSAVGSEYWLVDFSSRYSVDSIFRQLPAGIPYEDSDLLSPADAQFGL